MRRVVLVLVLTIALAAPPAAADAHAGGSAGGFEFPESVYWDGPTGSFYVSNFGGSELDPNGREPDGYVSKLNGEGSVVAAKWVTGLRSPKGIRRLGDRLFVADVGQLVVIDVAAAAIETVVDLEAVGAKFPNDVAVDEASGDLYVTDTVRNAIYRLPSGSLTPEVFLESAELDSPNGLLVDAGKLVVATYGPAGDPANPSPPDRGRLLLVDPSTKAITPLAGMPPTGRLDGIEKLDGDYLVTDNPGGRVLRVAPDGSATEVAKDLRNAADLGLRLGDRVAAVPELTGGSVRFLNL